MPGQLLHSPADIVRQLLIDLGLGSNPGIDPQQPWPVSASGEPAAPDSAITVYNAEGRDQGRLQLTGVRIVYQGFQVRVRSSTQPIGYAKAAAIASALDAVFNRSVTVPMYLSAPAGTYLVEGVTRTGEVIDLGKWVPNNKLSLHTLNGVVCVTQTS